MPLATEDASDLLQKFSAEELSSPEKIVDGQTFEKQGRGPIGALIRTAMGIPPYVRVVNEHDEDILVVVSKYRPNQMLSSAGITVSATGMGVTFDSTSFLSPACKKPLAGRAEGREKSTGSFPLWTREEGFGVISIFKGPQQELCIENDQIPLGATAFFSGQPNLRIIDFRGVEIPSGSQTQLQ
ncbi:unnamed protein product [Clonostachys solani]|uniref:Uncharacterized protein n=1 Tax=Clonostachys solani TaxID=160281 RepID=A0A9P0EJN8_9HYPO|nr:unnamed protein product [Clonostachys solani]